MYPCLKNIGGFLVKQLNGFSYELENPEQDLDFYIDAHNSKLVQILVFDSKIPVGDNCDPFLTEFEENSLEKAIISAMNYKRQ